MFVLAKVPLDPSAGGGYRDGYITSPQMQKVDVLVRREKGSSGYASVRWATRQDSAKVRRQNCDSSAYLAVCAAFLAIWWCRAKDIARQDATSPAESAPHSAVFRPLISSAPAAVE